MDRRKFLQNSGVALGVATWLPSCTPNEAAEFAPGDWASVRSQFPLTKNKIHMSQMLLASHPRPVALEIERHRKNFDEDPAGYWEAHWQTAELKVQEAAARYMKTEPTEIGLTDSTTMGLAMLYNGLQLKPGDEILTSTHDHYSTEKSLEYAAKKRQASIRKIVLYEDPAAVTVDDVVSRIAGALAPATRVVALTWVHSSTGVKLPIGAIAKAIRSANEQRPPASRIYFCVDGVHGFGIDDVGMPDLDCDFFVAGTHKWIFGPRGTGVIYGRRDAWDFFEPTIPPFSYDSYGMWLGAVEEKKIDFNNLHTPGGFHSFEHRWALGSAFDFQMQIGKPRVAERTHQLSTMLKEGIKEIGHIKLYTPASDSLSAGINCFDVGGMTAEDVVRKLHDRHEIFASVAPYRVANVRLTPCLANLETDVTACLRALETIKE